MIVTPTTYEHDGQVYTRVTSVIHAVWPDPDLQDWRASVGKVSADRALRHAEKIGTTSDKLITAILNGAKFKTPPQVEVRQVLRGFTEWHRLNPIGPTALQQTLLDQTLSIGGTPDCVAGDEAFDWKTSSRLSLSHLIQIGVYWSLLERHGQPVRRYRLVRFDKILGIWEERILTRDGIQWDDRFITRLDLAQAFQHCLGLYRSWQTLTQPQEVAI